MNTHPLANRARVLLSSVFGPYAQDDEFGSRSINPMELYHKYCCAPRAEKKSGSRPDVPTNRQPSSIAAIGPRSCLLGWLFVYLLQRVCFTRRACYQHS